MCKKRKERPETDLSTGPHEPQPSLFHREAKQGRLQIIGGWGDGRGRAERKPHSSKGEGKREADSGKAAAQGHPTLGYTYRDSFSPPRRATFTMEEVLLASKGRKGQPPRRLPPNVSPS